MIDYNTLRENDPLIFPPMDPSFTSEQVLAAAKEYARNWRNDQLKLTDWIVSVTDHPQRSAYLTYRTKLRDWPSLDSFPDSKPTL